MSDKYTILRKEEPIRCQNKKLYRIKALKDFGDGDVEKGDIGGYIERRGNLSQFDNTWVHGNAQVYGDARVYGNAQIFGDARVFDNARVSGTAQIFGYALVYQDQEIISGKEDKDE